MKTQSRDQLAQVVGIGMSVLALVLILVNVVVPWIVDRENDLIYGSPRVYHTAAVVGHDDAPNHPTLFVAMNLQGEVGVIEVPGGDYRKARELTGPHLFGADQAKVPVRVHVGDVNKDGKLDLVVTIRDEEVLYINTGPSFQLATDQERDAYANRGVK